MITADYKKHKKLQLIDFKRKVGIFVFRARLIITFVFYYAQLHHVTIFIKDNMMQPSTIEQREREILEMLIKIYGPLLSGRVLWRILGYPSPAAFRQSRIRQKTPVLEFKIEGRRGRFALASDVAKWLVNTGADVSACHHEPSQEETKKNYLKDD